jgi:molybdenum cofactor cytidylyltransferase
MIAAVVPAAGKSERMGQPKLLLKLDGQTLLARVVSALRAGGVRRVIVVTPPAEKPESAALAAAAEQAGAEIIVPPTQPAEMRTSVELAIERLARDLPPRHIVLTPADSPGITADLVARLLEAADCFRTHIVVPSCGARRGHPVVLPWPAVVQVSALPQGMGVNALLHRLKDQVLELHVSSSEIAGDIDTPEDLSCWKNTLGAGARYTVRLFALAKERAGRSEIEIELPPAARVGDLRAVLGVRVPALGALMQSALIAVDEEYAGDDVPLSPGSRIAVIPPVSGGAGIHLFERTATPLEYSP